MEVKAAAFRDKLLYTAQRNLLKAKWLLPANIMFWGQISGGGCYTDHPKGGLNHHIQIGRIKFGLDNTDTSNNRTPMQSSGHLAVLKLQLDTPPTLCHTDTVTPPTLCYNTHTLSHNTVSYISALPFVNTPHTAGCTTQHPYSVTQHSFLCYCTAFCLHVTHSWHILITVARWRQATHHFDKTRKNLCTSVAGAAFGYSWHTLATSIAQDTPPRYPSTFEYTPFSGGQTQAISALAQLKADNFKPTGGPGSCMAT